MSERMLRQTLEIMGIYVKRGLNLISYFLLLTYDSL